ncbi:MAG: hypothetical protein ABS75_19955 [Pelagibacterium sp. SCN 63-23]|nr:MAG: hypothetical protein ABS75_19955 [Pelagibacterium sp. SCN 63-23]
MSFLELSHEYFPGEPLLAFSPHFQCCRPRGGALDGGGNIAIDETARLPPSRFSICLPVGYLVPLAFDGGTIEALQARTRPGLRALAHGHGQAVSFSVPPSGFATALDIAGIHAKRGDEEAR